MIRLCFELAGVASVDPRFFSMRQLIYLADGKQKTEWQRASYLAAYIADSIAMRKQPTDINKLLPARYRIPDTVVTQDSQKMSFALLGAALSAISKRKEKREKE